MDGFLPRTAGKGHHKPISSQELPSNMHSTPMIVAMILMRRRSPNLVVEFYVPAGLK
jgi:hypothetical protein